MADARLKIAVDGRELIGKPTGVGRYLVEILRAWKVSGFPHRVMVITPSAPSPALITDLPDIAWHVEAAPGAGTMEQGPVDASARVGAPGCVLWGYRRAALPCPMVVAIHDVVLRASRVVRPAGSWRRRWLTRGFARQRTVLTLQNSRMPKSAIPERAGSYAVGAARAPWPRAEIDATRSHWVHFQPSSIADLIHAFVLAAPRVPGGRLVLIYDNRPHRTTDCNAASAGIGDRASGGIRDDAARDLLYESARAPATCRTMKVRSRRLAMAHDVPSVVLDTPVSREIYADAALKVPVDTRAIADAIVSLLTDDGVHARLVNAGRERLARFSWIATAATVRRALEEAAR